MMLLPTIGPFVIGVLVLGFFAGLLIGCIGIGGIILVPALVYVAGYPIETAISAAMIAFLFSGIVGSAALWREHSHDIDAVATAHKLPKRAKNGGSYQRWVLWGAIGAMPAALLGAYASNKLPSNILELAIGSLVLISGLNTLRQPAASKGENAEFSGPVMLSVGAGAGFGSALTGTGGPLILVPVLLWMQLPVLSAIRLGQAIQLPIATLATVGNFLYGAPDIMLSLLLAAGVAIGTWLGARVSDKLRRSYLRQLVSLALLLVGAYVIAKVALG